MSVESKFIFCRMTVVKLIWDFSFIENKSHIRVIS
jgi:hypothetical protein